MLNHIEDFMKLREIELYALIHRSFDNKNLPEWPKSFMKDRKRKNRKRNSIFQDRCQ